MILDEPVASEQRCKKRRISHSKVECLDLVAEDTAMEHRGTPLSSIFELGRVCVIWINPLQCKGGLLLQDSVIDYFWVVDWIFSLISRY